MKYSLKELFDFMESGRPVKVTCADGKTFSGKCWAYSDVGNMEEDGIEEPSIEIGSTMIYQSEIRSIEFID